MKILHLNTHDASGGAARAVTRIHRALRASGADSRMLVQVKSGDDPTVSGPESKPARSLGYVRPSLDRLALYRYPKKDDAYFHPAVIPFSGVLRKIRKIDPDVVNLHWITGGFLRIEDLMRIQKPVVWTMHDMWTFTGGCHYNETCGKYLASCGSCPVLGSKRKEDLSTLVFKRKQRVFQMSSAFAAVGISRWLCDAARKSTLLKDKKIINIPNPIDPQIFSPVEKTVARDMLGLPPDKKILLFGAKDALQDRRKGFPELCRALLHLASKNTELAVFGAGHGDGAPDVNLHIHYLGNFHDDLSLRIVYSAADVMVVPSLQENLSNIILESLACGTPVVAFRIGGNPDMVDHQSNGYLADPFDPADLACGIDWVLKHADASMLGENARQKILENFTPADVAAQYMRLYEKILAS